MFLFRYFKSMLFRFSNKSLSVGFHTIRRMLSRQDLLKYKAVNEPVYQYLPGSAEREKLIAALEKFKSSTYAVPIVIGDEEIHNVGEEKYQLNPGNHSHKVAKFSHASKELLEKAIKQSVDARKEWENRAPEERASIFLKAAKLVQDKYRYDILAAAMLGQGKTIVQGEIDATCEFIDFLTFNVQFYGSMLNYQPISTEISTNSMILRGMEGFWAAISPFNFTSIGGNLATAPVLVGNVTLWKPSDTAVIGNYITYKALREAGVPANVIQFVPSDGPTFGSAITNSHELAGINFTGSVPTFQWLWKRVGENLDSYRTPPRLLGELGGKNFHFIHPSAEPNSVAIATLMSGFEFCGQKCSACSRIYVPASLWPQIKEKMAAEMKQMKVGPVDEFDSFLSGVIDKTAYNRIMGYIDWAKKNPNDCTIVAGGTGDDSRGYYVQPTLIEAKNPTCKLMREEIFGPVTTAYVYDDSKVDEALELLKTTTKYALTGAIFAQDKNAIEYLRKELREMAGNFYINDKSTGAVVGQQPFGGARWSGTNDKAGGPFYLARFCSPQTCKETHKPLQTWRYPYMG